MIPNKIFKSTLIGAILSIASGGAFAHSILGGYLPADPSKVDVFRTACFKADGHSGLPDGNGTFWTLPISSSATTPDDTAAFVWAISKTDYNSGNVYATVSVTSEASGPIGNVQPPNDSDDNNVLPALGGTINAQVATAKTHATPFSGNDEPSLNVDGTGAPDHWGSNSYGFTGPDGSTGNGEYLIVISHDGTKEHNYDAIFHCINASSSGSATLAHTGQGSGFLNNGDSTISTTSDYEQLLEDGAGN